MPVPEDIIIHPSAIVEEGSSIGAGSRIWHHAHLRSGAKLGERCMLGKNVFVDQGVVLGSGVRIQNNVSVYHGVTVQDDVFIGPSVVFTNDRFPRAGGSWSPAQTLIGSGASIGANATLIAPLEIGSWAMVAAGSVVTRSVPAHHIVVGNPARHAGWICKCGRTRVSTTASELVCADCETQLAIDGAL